MTGSAEGAQYEGVDIEGSPADYLQVTFLGTGGPPPSLERHGISTLIKAGPHWLLFDTGRATLQRMHECGIPVDEIRNVFYTHLHSDHISGFGDFWMTGWFVLDRTAPLAVWGPPGTQRFVEGIKEAYHFDLSIRPQYEASAATGLSIEVTEFGEGVVFDRDGVVVSAFLVDHGPVVKPAYGFKVAWNGRAIVLSGDTTYCDAIVRHAAGADLLIHEVAGASARQIGKNPQLGKIVASHTSPEQLAAICRAAAPRCTLINHLGLWKVTPYDVLVRARAGHPHPVEISEDRMHVLVGPEIRILPPGVPQRGRSRDPLLR